MCLQTRNNAENSIICVNRLGCKLYAVMRENTSLDLRGRMDRKEFSPNPPKWRSGYGFFRDAGNILKHCPKYRRSDVHPAKW
mmetsp:Transcript_10732/g.20668  ORF Transcript_10732/g.20668 Transcript_10732/m.20668 type:complete len:82 (+) Transcript_10732:426-671(+)